MLRKCAKQQSSEALPHVYRRRRMIRSLKPRGKRMKKYSLESWRELHSSTDPDRYEESDDLDYLMGQVEKHRTEGQIVLDEIYRRTDQPNTWERIE
jgi:hypothetical protein